MLWGATFWMLWEALLDAKDGILDAKMLPEAS